MGNLPRSAPEKQGVRSQAVIDFLNKIKEENQELHSFMLLKNGFVISECWWEPYGKNYRHKLFSLSKSFTSTAIGMAVDEGLLTVDTLLSDIFKDEFKQLGNDIDEKMHRMTVRHLLVMGTGMEYENWNWHAKGPHIGNNIMYFLKSHVKNEPGSKFFYHTLATYMQSAIITRITGQKLADYLKPRLFDPLGIDPVWEEDKMGINMGGFGLNITTEEIAKFGHFLLQKGEWSGKQLVSEKWIEEATDKQIDNVGWGNPDWNVGYGYQFWRCRADGVYRGDGMYGQYCIVMPEENSVIAITSYCDMQKVLDLIYDTLLPALRENISCDGNAPLDDTADYKKMKDMQKNLSHLNVKSENVIAFPKIRGEYKVKDADDGHLIEKVYLESAPDECIMAFYLRNNYIPVVYRVKNNEWTENTSSLTLDYDSNVKFMRLKTYGEWGMDKETNGNLLSVICWFYETPVKNYIKVRFGKDDSKITVEFTDNSGLPAAIAPHTYVKIN